MILSFISIEKNSIPPSLYILICLKTICNSFSILSNSSFLTSKTNVKMPLFISPVVYKLSLSGIFNVFPILHALYFSYARQDNCLTIVKN